MSHHLWGFFLVTPSPKFHIPIQKKVKNMKSTIENGPSCTGINDYCSDYNYYYNTTKKHWQKKQQNWYDYYENISDKWNDE